MLKALNLTCITVNDCDISISIPSLKRHEALMMKFLQISLTKNGIRKMCSLPHRGRRGFSLLKFHCKEKKSYLYTRGRHMTANAGL